MTNSRWCGRCAETKLGMKRRQRMIRVVVDGEEVASFARYDLLWAWARGMADREPDPEAVTGMLPETSELARESQNAA